MQLKRGFTLIELLVTMSIIGLLLAVAGPSLQNMLDARLNNASEQEFVAKVIALPLLATANQQSFSLLSGEELDSRFHEYRFEPRLNVSQSGFCESSVIIKNDIEKYLVSAPYCSVTSVD